MSQEDSAHPRVSGENRPRPIARNRRYGSSPRERGKPALDTEDVSARGLIPA